MIKPEDFKKMTPEQQKACDPIEVLASALSTVAQTIDEARAAKDAGMLLAGIANLVEVADQMEALGAQIAGKIVAHALKKIMADGTGAGEKPLDDDGKVEKVLDFNLGMSKTPAKA